MQHLELTLPTPAENLALDEALLEWGEEEPSQREVLRLWESPEPMVVVGRSSRVQKEVNESTCSERRIPILRRSSGGATVVAGPGCLMYALVLSLEARSELKDIGRAHAFILGRLVSSLGSLLTNNSVIACKGTSECKTAKHDCAGKNACKGEGVKQMTKAECDAAKAKAKS